MLYLQTRSTGLKERTLHLPTLRSSSPCCSGRIHWRGWAQVQTRSKRKCDTTRNSVRTRRAQQVPINTHVTVSATSAPLIIPRKKLRSSSSMAVYPAASSPFPLINCNYFLGRPWIWFRAWSGSVVYESDHDLGQRPLIKGMHECGSGIAGPRHSSRSPLAGLPFTKPPAIPRKVTGRKLCCIIYCHDIRLACGH